MRGKDLLSIADLTPDELTRILDLALDMKRNGYSPCSGGQDAGASF